MRKEEGLGSIGDLLIATLFSARSTLLFKSILRERKIARYEKDSVRVALSRLRKNEMVKRSATGWSITEKGMVLIKKKRLLAYLSSPFLKTQPASMIISFDIPEQKRKIRNWLRNQLKIFNYKMLQQSLWIGPGPLPEAFLKRLENLGIRKNIKTFKITKRNA